MMAVVKQEVAQMLSRNIIRPSKNHYSAPMVTLTNKDGSNRIFVDFRKLKEVTRNSAFQLPRLHQIPEHHHGAKIFSSLDLASGNRQVPLAESAIPKTAFVIFEVGRSEFFILHSGHYNSYLSV